jgi:hypothetical protein
MLDSERMCLMSFIPDFSHRDNFSLAEVLAAEEAAMREYYARTAAPDPAPEPQVPPIVGDPAPASTSPLPPPAQLITCSPDLATASPSALPPKEPIPPIGEENVPADEMCIHDAPLLFKSLPITQQRVLIELWGGRSMRQAAHICGINRMTINRWMRHDARFIAAHNQTIEFQQKEASIRMAGMLSKSMDNLDEELEHGDMKATMFVINKVMQIPRGSQSPRKIAKRIRRRDQRLQEFLNSPEDESLISPDHLLDCSTPLAPAAPTIISTIANPAEPPPSELHSLPSPALPPAETRQEPEEKGETPIHAPEAPETKEHGA